jgi:hypothetical protein
LEDVEVDFVAEFAGEGEEHDIVWLIEVMEQGKGEVGSTSGELFGEVRVGP